MGKDAPVQGSAAPRWSDSIDKYDFISTLKPGSPEREDAEKKQAHAKECLKKVVENTEASDALYLGIPKGSDGKPIPAPTTARKKFLDYLQNEILTKERKEPANVEGVKLKDLLGPDGFALYLAALNEESQSAAFREAVMLRATNHYDGPKWAQRVIAPYGGPSAAGKSVSQADFLKQIEEYIPKMEGDEEPGNDVVSVDGGIEREVSLIRGLTLQTALGLGYALIDDLDKHKAKDDKGKEVKIKSFVEEATLATPGLSMVIPQTYTSEAKNLLTGVGADDFKEYDQVDNGEAIVIFGIVEAEHENVVKNGTSRAANSSTLEKKDIQPDRKPPCESKKYHDHHFSGTKLSRAARRTYEGLDAHPSKPRIVVTVTSDFTFIKKDPTAPGGWVKADKDEPWDKGMIGIVERDFNAYLAHKQQMKKEYDAGKNILKALVTQRSTLSDELKTVAGLPKEKMLQEQIEILDKHIIKTKARHVELYNEVVGDDKHNIKGWLKKNGWKQKAQTEITVTPPKLDKNCIFVEPDTNNKTVGWKEKNQDQPWNASMIIISRKDFEEFKAFKEDSKKHLDQIRAELKKPGLSDGEIEGLRKMVNVIEKQLDTQPKILKDWLKARQPLVPTKTPEAEKAQRDALKQQRQALRDKKEEEKKEQKALIKEQKMREKEQKQVVKTQEKEEKSQRRLSRKQTIGAGIRKIFVPAMKPDEEAASQKKGVSFKESSQDKPQTPVLGSARVVRARSETIAPVTTSTHHPTALTPGLQSVIAQQAQEKAKARATSQGAENLKENASAPPPRPPRLGRTGDGDS